MNTPDFDVPPMPEPLEPDFEVGASDADTQADDVAGPPPWQFEPIYPHGFDDFWNATPILQTIRDYAHARMCAPWAVLGNCLAQVVAWTPPTVQLPPLRGGNGSLNLFIAFVAVSGGGKGTAASAARDLLQTSDDTATYAARTIGSGEGLAAAYVHRIADPDDAKAPKILAQHHDRALFDVAEVDTLTTLGARKGATLLAELRKVWIGESLGFQNRSEDSTLEVKPHSYRAALVLGVQPNRAETLLNDSDGGTPQRFIWLPAIDPAAPGTPPPLPAPIQWHNPAQPGQVMNVPDDVKALVIAHFDAQRRGQVAALDGHAVLACIKAAAALALLHGHSTVTAQDWHLARQLMGVSAWQRNALQDALIGESRRRRLDSAKATAERQTLISAMTDNAAVIRAKQAILNKLKRVGAASKKELTNSIRANNRANFAPALDELIAAGLVEETANGFCIAGSTVVRRTTTPKMPSDLHKQAGSTVVRRTTDYATVIPIREEKPRNNQGAENGENTPPDTVGECQHHRTGPNGQRNGKPRQICKDCHKTFYAPDNSLDNSQSDLSDNNETPQFCGAGNRLDKPLTVGCGDNTNCQHLHVAS